MKKMYRFIIAFIKLISFKADLPNKRLKQSYIDGKVELENEKKVIRCSNKESYNVDDFENLEHYHIGNTVIVSKLYWKTGETILIRSIDVNNLDNSTSTYRKSALFDLIPVSLDSPIPILMILLLFFTFGIMQIQFIPFLVSIAWLFFYTKRLEKKCNNWTVLYLPTLFRIIGISMFLMLVNGVFNSLELSAVNITVKLLISVGVFLYYLQYLRSCVHPLITFLKKSKKNLSSRLLRKAKEFNHCETPDENTDALPAPAALVVNIFKSETMNNIDQSDNSNKEIVIDKSINIAEQKNTKETNFYAMQANISSDDTDDTVVREDNDANTKNEERKSKDSDSGNDNIENEDLTEPDKYEKIDPIWSQWMTLKEACNYSTTLKSNYKIKQFMEKHPCSFEHEHRSKYRFDRNISEFSNLP